VEDTAPNTPSELDVLKNRAKQLGIQHSGNIGVDALRSKINEKLNSEPSKEDEPVAEEASEKQPTIEELQAQLAALKSQSAEYDRSGDVTDKMNPLAGDTAGTTPSAQMSKRQRLVKEATKLVRVRIQNLDPKKADLRGEVFTVGNRYVGTIKKFIPYGEATDGGYHLPWILYENLRDRKFLHIRTFKDRVTKQDRVETSWQREFAFEVLPQLTSEELAQLKTAQIAANNI
jgi:chemotaxis protein histidine kinase CheA